MRKHSYSAVAMLVLLGCLAVSASAQCNGLRSRVNIPFQFKVGKTTLPAGDYAITCQNRGPNLLAIRSLDGKTGARSVAMLAIAAKTKDHGYLVFHRYGSQYFLAQAWSRTMQSGFELPQSRAERLAAREIAGIKPKREEIALNLRD